MTEYTAHASNRVDAEYITRHCKGPFDFSGANLRDANLRDANLRSANLRHTDLQGANLRSADLRHTDLQGANLRGANLRDANLQGANLRNANLRDANLRDANLRHTDLQCANLRRTDLQGADLDYSCLPLWCGGQGAKIDRKIAAQLVLHALAFVVDPDDCPEYAEIRKAAAGLCSKSHRRAEVGWL